MTFTEARELIGNRDSKKIANNTYLVPVLDGGIAVRLHNTNVVVFYEDRTEVFTGGWRTVTTKDRINTYLPAGGIYQKAGQWFWSVQGEPVTFAEGDAVVKLADYRMAVQDANGLTKGCF